MSERAHHRPMRAGCRLLRRHRRRRGPGAGHRGRRPGRQPAGPRRARRRGPGDRRAGPAPGRDRGHRDDRRGLVRLARRLAGRLPVAAVRAPVVGVRRPGDRRPGVRRRAGAAPRWRASSPGSPTRPGPTSSKTMVDEVLRGIAVGDFADVLFRAAAFARVVATGRAALDGRHRRGRCSGCWCSPSSSRPPGTRSSPTACPDGVVHAGPGAPHGAWPLVAAEIGTRGAAARRATFTNDSPRPEDSSFRPCLVRLPGDVVRTRAGRGARPGGDRVGAGCPTRRTRARARTGRCCSSAAARSRARSTGRADAHQQGPRPRR